jgi:hypothetical protein
MLVREHTLPGHVLKFSIRKDTRGWNVREELDDNVVHSASYSDWHRVERALRRFEADLAAARRAADQSTT